MEYPDVVGSGWRSFRERSGDELEERKVEKGE